MPQCHLHGAFVRRALGSGRWIGIHPLSTGQAQGKHNVLWPPRQSGQPSLAREARARYAVPMRISPLRNCSHSFSQGQIGCWIRSVAGSCERLLTDSSAAYGIIADLPTTSLRAKGMEGPSMLVRTPPLDFHLLTCGTAVPFLLLPIAFRRLLARLSPWVYHDAGVGPVSRLAKLIPGCPPARFAEAPAGLRT